MILQNIKPINWGPFLKGTVLYLEPDVTVLTATNDAGKSSLLRLLDAAYRYPALDKVNEAELNLSYRRNSKFDLWNDDREFGCSLSLIAGDDIDDYIRSVDNQKPFRKGDQIDITLNLAPAAASATIGASRSGKPVPTSTIALKKMPHVIGMPTAYPIGDVVELKSANHAERLLLRAAFGAQFTAERLVAMHKSAYNAELSKAQRQLDAAMARVIPPSLRLRVQLIATGSQYEIAFQPVDQDHGYSPLSSRGTGIRALLSLAASLLEVNMVDHDVLIYVDEPETSLHSDAQHRLRGYLEELGRRDKVQVIYATHSPAMINNMRPRSVRLLKRVQTDDDVQTEIIGRPIDDNFVQIRTTLGVSASDSLMYAPVTIVVEGASESVCLSDLLVKLYELGAPDFENVSQIVNQCHIADGRGDSYVKTVAFAVSQNCEVVCFLDGDKKVEASTRKLFPTVAFININDRDEFEQLLSPELYFMALRNAIGDAAQSTIDPGCFAVWLAEQVPIVQRKAYTKQICAWLEEVAPDFSYVKPRILKNAVQLISEPSQVRLDELKQLVSEVRKRLSSVS